MISSLYEDREGNIWCGVSGGLVCYNPGNKQFTTYYNNELGDEMLIPAILEHNDILLIGTNNYGLLGFDKKNKKFVNDPGLDPELKKRLIITGFILCIKTGKES